MSRRPVAFVAPTVDPRQQWVPGTAPAGDGEVNLVEDCGPDLGPLLCTGADLLAEEPERPAMVDGMMDRGEVWLLAGAEKDAAKTFAAVDLALAVVTGTPWMGRAVVKQTDPVLVITETPLREIRKRLRMLAAARGIDLATVVHRIAVVSDRITIMPSAELETVRRKALVAATRTRDMARRDQHVTEPEAMMRAVEKGVGPRVAAGSAILSCAWSLVVLDSVRFLMRGDENSSADMQTFVDGIREIAAETDALVLALHHTSKGGAAGEVRAARGSTALTAGVDGILSVDARDVCTMHMTARCRAPLAPIAYQLVVEDGAARLAVTEAKSADVADRITEVLRASAKGMSPNAIREAVGASGATVTKALSAMARAGLVRRGGTETRPLWVHVPTMGEVFG